MTAKKKTTLWIISVILTALILAAGIHTSLYLRDVKESRVQAAEAAELFEADVSSIEAAEWKPRARTSSLNRNSRKKDARAEEIEELEILRIVNPWTPLPEDWDPELVFINNIEPELIGTNDYEAADARCADALVHMLMDCRAAGHGIYVCSAYRPHEKQIMLYENKIQRVINEGCPPEDAPAVAAMTVAVPGTSEHELGLAADIIDDSYPYLNSEQEKTEGQKWLMEHCWEYGFILRYPNGTSDITGIIYEPWHYRYVGEKFAAEIKELGVTLEEYVAMRRGR